MIENRHGLSETAFNFITLLLEKDISKRLGNSFEDIQKLKKHNFFENINWKTVVNRKSVPVFIPNTKEVENYFYFLNYSDVGINTGLATADEFDLTLNEVSETPVLIKEFSFF